MFIQKVFLVSTVYILYTFLLSKSRLTSVLHESRKQCSKFPVRSAGIIPISKNKVLFEAQVFNVSEWDKSPPSYHFDRVFDEDGFPFPNSAYRTKPDEMIFFCDWHPVLFGIDEDEIPLSDIDEELYEVDIEELREKALNLTESDIEVLRVFHEDMTDDQVREIWVEENIPRYARRARAKPILERNENEMFECICNIDLFYCRHHVPRFSEGVKEGEELRVPHFKAFWDKYNRRDELQDEDRWSAIIEKKPEEVVEPSEFPFRSVFNKSYRKIDMRRLRKSILASIRPLDCREVRRYRMPFSEALYLELQEDGFNEVALFFKYLLIKDYFIHEAPENTNPTLRQSKGKLLKLIAFLKLADKYSRSEEYHKKAMIFLRTAKYYNEHDENWWWLAEEFYAKAVKESQKSVIDGGRSEAVARFMLGTFLLDYTSSVEQAQEHLSIARALSMGKEWVIDKNLCESQEILYSQTVNYLCRVLILQSKELRENGKPDEALPLIHRSYKLCRESTLKREIEMETYFELGMTYQEVGFLHWAKVALRKFIEIAKSSSHPRRACDGYLEIAICNRMEGDLEICHQNLLSYLNLAKKKEDENLIAYGYRYLGEFHLYRKQPKEASEYFKNAFMSFNEQATKLADIPFEKWMPEHFLLSQEVRLSRSLCGLAMGEHLAKSICQLIISAKDSKSQSQMLKLLHWKVKGELILESDTALKMDSAVAFEGWENELDMTGMLMAEQIMTSDVDIQKTVRFADADDDLMIIL